MFFAVLRAAQNDRLWRKFLVITSTMLDSPKCPRSRRSCTAAAMQLPPG